MREYCVSRNGGRISTCCVDDLFILLHSLGYHDDAMTVSDWAEHASVGETYHGSDYIVEVVDDED